MDMLCNETDIAEIELEVTMIHAPPDKQSQTDMILSCALFFLQMGNFQLHVRRRVDASAGPASQPATAATSASGGLVLHPACQICKYTQPFAALKRIAQLFLDPCWEAEMR